MVCGSLWSVAVALAVVCGSLACLWSLVVVAMAQDYTTVFPSRTPDMDGREVVNELINGRWERGVKFYEFHPLVV